ncbi:MAG TPA: SLC13 family permease [Bryobacteraceae bacterium]|nr:SLC13 family permease [Bryobacteraceae bacterium]
MGSAAELTTNTGPAIKPVSPDDFSASWGKWLGWILMIVAPCAIWFAPLDLAVAAKHAIAISLFMILAWAFRTLSPGLAGLIGCYLYWALGVVPIDVAFSGFADDTPWFLLAAILFGAVAIKSGLARRIAFGVMLRAGTSYSRLLLGLIIADALITLCVPSGVPRVVIMAAIALGVNQAFGLEKGSNVSRGMLLILTYAASVFDKTVIAGAATITARGAMERFGHMQVLYSQWLLAYLPVDVVLIVVAWRLTLRFFPPEKQALPGGKAYLKNELAKLGRWTLVEKKALAFLLVAVVLWLTDSLHHVSASKIALGIALLALLPRIGVLGMEDLRRVDYLLLFFVASVVSMGKVLGVTKSLDVFTQVLFAWITPLIPHTVLAPFALYWIGFAYHLVLASGISMLGTSMPGLMTYAAAHHLNALALGMVWTFSSGATIFVYQNAVLIVGYSYGCFTARDLLRLGLCLTVVNSLLLLIVVPFYWPLIGIQY